MQQTHRIRHMLLICTGRRVLPQLRLQIADERVLPLRLSLQLEDEFAFPFQFVLHFTRPLRAVGILCLQVKNLSALLGHLRTEF